MYSPEQGNKHSYFSVDGEMNTWPHSASSTKLQAIKNVQTIKAGNVVLMHDECRWYTSYKLENGSGWRTHHDLIYWWAS